jgi:WNK lysine deficient protein kinase
MINNIIESSPNEKYIKLNELIGQGAYKIVHKGIDTYTGMEIAWNTINVSILPESEKKRITEEIEVLKECSNKNINILNMYNHWYDQIQNNVIIITQYCPSGNIREFLNKNQQIRLCVIKKWLKQILSAIGFLHSKNIIHRDIKLPNIFLKDGNSILGDMGLAKRQKELTFSPIGTPEYMAPEIYDEKYDEKIDIYSFGLCILELITGEIPYNEYSNITKLWKAVTNNIKPKSILKVKNNDAISIINKCIDNNKNKRPCIKNILNSPFFYKNENNNIFIKYDIKEIHTDKTLNTLNKSDD